MKRRALVILLLLSGLVLFGQKADQEPAAEAIITSVSKEVMAVSLSGKKRALKKGDRVYAGELVETGEKASCTLVLADGSELSLPSRSRVQINDSRANPRGPSRRTMRARPRSRGSAPPWRRTASRSTRGRERMRAMRGQPRSSGIGRS